MLSIVLAFKNIAHAGLRTWLNVFVLSFAFVLIVCTEGMYDGLSEQVRDSLIDAEIGGGQFWMHSYDPFDPFTIEDAHAVVSDALQAEIKSGMATPILICQTALFPNGHVQSALLKGIDPAQKTLNIPSWTLKNFTDTNAIPGLIGARMAKNTGLKKGDYVTARWKNINGTFDAGDIKIVEVMNTNVQSIDRDQIWIPLSKLRAMMQAPEQATIIVLDKHIKSYPPGSPDWVLKDHKYLFRDIDDLIKRKKIQASFLFILLMGMALLAVFDTQVLSIFKRRKEIGTMMALGMTRWDVIKLFTLEGCLTGILAFIVGSIYGIPILAWLAKSGISLPSATESIGFATGTMLYPKYGWSLYLGVSAILFIAVVIVSFLPTRKITKLKPTDALKGKMS